MVENNTKNKIKNKEIQNKKLLELKEHQIKLKKEVDKRSFFLNSIIQNIPDMIFVKDAKDLKFELFNNAGEKLLGHRTKDLIGKNDYDFFPKKQAEFFISKDKKVLKSKTLLDIKEEPIQTKNGLRFLHTKKIPLLDKKGKSQYLLGISEDITERKKIEERLKEYQEEKFKAIFDNAIDGIALYDLKNKKISTANQAFCNMLGYNLKSVEKIGIKDIHPKEYFPKILKGFQNQMKGFIFTLKNIPVKRLNNTIFYADITASKVIIDEKEFVLGVFRDVTEKKKNDERLQKLAFIIENTLEGHAIFTFSKKSKIVYVNRAWEKITGYKSKEVLNKKEPFILSSTKNNPEQRKRLLKTIKLGHSFQEQMQWLSKDNKIIYVDVLCMPLKEKGKVVQWFNTVRDITYKKNIEDSLRESEERFKNIFNYSAVGVSLVTPDGRWLEVNNSLCKITGYSRKELLKKSFDKITYPADLMKSNKDLQLLLLNKIKHAYVEKRYLQKNGKIVWVYLSITLVRDFNNKPIYFVVLTEDITEKKENERKFKESEEKYRKLFETSKDSILILDADTGKIIDLNPFAQDLMEYSKEELLGKKIYDINSFVNIVQNEKKFNEFKASGYVRYDNLIFKTKLNKIKNIEFVSNIYDIGNKKVIQFNIRDITERIRKENELEKAKNDFLSMTSHQLRTPLSATKWVLEMLLKDKNLFNPKQQEKLDDLEISNERLINLVNKLLDVTRIESGKLVINKNPIELRALVDDLAAQFKVLASSKNKIIKVVGPTELKNVYCDPLLIHEALENLLSNAITYSLENSKEIIIEIKEQKDNYIISVHNDGVIDPVAAEKINKFDKFMRGSNAIETEPAGSGLGLYITKKVVEASGGNIWFESNAKSGTTFYLTIIKK